MSDLEKELREIVEEGCAESNNDDFNVCDYSGGNIDDAYQLGVDAGQYYLAASLLKKHFKE